MSMALACMIVPRFIVMREDTRLNLATKPIMVQKEECDLKAHIYDYAFIAIDE